MGEIVTYPRPYIEKKWLLRKIIYILILSNDTWENTMISPEIKKKLIEDLNELPYELQKKVQNFAHALLITQTQGSEGKEIVKFSGIFSKDDSKKMMAAIEEGCGQVDQSEW
jgi:hypothetical protein